MRVGTGGGDCLGMHRRVAPLQTSNMRPTARGIKGFLRLSVGLVCNSTDRRAGMRIVGVVKIVDGARGMPNSGWSGRVHAPARRAPHMAASLYIEWPHTGAGVEMEGGGSRLVGLHGPPAGFPAMVAT